MSEAPRINLVEFTVSELAAALKRTVEDAYAYVRVRGEISGFRGPHASGHCYFALKDEGAKIEAVIWKSAFARMRIKPEEGLEVIATGKLSTYPSKSTYQIVIEALEPAGLGALMALLEQRKKTLAAEGLFDEARKQLIPFLPKRIGVVTSARGGGSLEDLWSFNEEIVVRAAAASMIPLISAVGHETDVTLIDFAADRRAPTPTAAAEMAVPVRADLRVRVDGLARRSLACWLRGQEARRTELRAAIRALPTAEELFALPRQRLDHAGTRLPRALIANAQIHHAQFSRVAGRLGPQILRARVNRCCELVAALGERAKRAENVARMRRRERLATANVRLAAGLRANRDAHRNRIRRDCEHVAALSERARRAVNSLLRQRATSLER